MIERPDEPPCAARNRPNGRPCRSSIALPPERMRRQRRPSGDSSRSRSPTIRSTRRRAPAITRAGFSPGWHHWYYARLSAGWRRSISTACSRPTCRLLRHWRGRGQSSIASVTAKLAGDRQDRIARSGLGDMPRIRVRAGRLRIGLDQPCASPCRRGRANESGARRIVQAVGHRMRRLLGLAYYGYRFKLCRSFRLQAGLLDDPLRDLALVFDEAGSLEPDGRRFDRTIDEHSLAEVALVHDARDLARDLGHDRFRGTGGGEQAEPGRGISPLRARPASGCQETAASAPCRDHQTPDMAALDLRHHVGQRGWRSDRAGQNCVDHLAAATERHAHDIGAGFSELLHKMRERKRERAVAERAGLGFRQRDKSGWSSPSASYW